MAWGWIVTALLVIGLVVLVLLVVRNLGLQGGRNDPRPASHPRDRQLLDERYARGEIDGAAGQRRCPHCEIFRRTTWVIFGHVETLEGTIPSGREIWFDDAAATCHKPVDTVLPPETMELPFADRPIQLH